MEPSHNWCKLRGTKLVIRFCGFPAGRRSMKLLYLSVIVCLLIATATCGGGTNSTSQPGPLSGNWQITIVRHHFLDEPITFTGFLLQSGNSVTGTIVFSFYSCSGVAPITGTVNGSNLTLTVNQFGQDMSFTGTMGPRGASMSGQFSTLPGGCTDAPSTGTWSAVPVNSVAGSFHGTFVSVSNGTLNVTGSLAQGPNTGNSNATLSGTITTSGPPRFCQYITTDAISGAISGEAVVLNLFGPDGSPITQITGSITADGTSFSGTYLFQGISSSCPGDRGTVQLLFP